MSTHDEELKELLEFFKTAKYPTIPFRLNKYIIVHNVDGVIAKSVSDIKGYNGSEKVLDSLFKHLREVKELCLKEA
ncbi:hypothetical protein SAMN04487995_1765 [Dyadobacter koreensis]|uniref:DUF6965 domain-containing protein n=1 Tax=Dyadobacter koreensis TaxID=408657 RepID=A0A1H6SPK2_9BACT|nr:hypothetical protein [Dyadobacter koreensis]SEI69858.1 hypothetical protein SAMN04487995_1765 [Dyadobacter koreensis]